MKVVAFNGSPKAEGNTFHALKLVAEELANNSIDTEIVHVGNKNIRPCAACGQCKANKNEACSIETDLVNGWIQKMKNADGIILGSPVHFSSIGASLKAFLDRAFYVAGANDGLFRHKVGASLVAVRRSGGLPAFNELNNFLMYAEMLIPGANYWNVIHGTTPGEVHEDKEGVQIMKVLGQNMSWAIKLVENGKGKVEEPKREQKIATNFVR